MLPLRLVHVLPSLNQVDMARLAYGLPVGTRATVSVRACNSIGSGSFVGRVPFVVGESAPPTRTFNRNGPFLSA